MVVAAMHASLLQSTDIVQKSKIPAGSQAGAIRNEKLLTWIIIKICNNGQISINSSWRISMEQKKCILFYLE